MTSLVPWSTELNQKTLERFGFKGKAGPQYGLQGEKFLDTLSLADQQAYSTERRHYGGQQNYVRNGGSVNAQGDISSILSDFFKKFSTSLAIPGEGAKAPSAGDDSIQAQVRDQLVKAAKMKGRESTINSDFQALDNPNPSNIRKSLLGA